MSQNNEGLTDNEVKLSRLLIERENDHDLLIATMLACIDSGLVDEVIEMIEGDPEIDMQTIVDYVCGFTEVHIVDDGDDAY